MIKKIIFLSIIFLHTSCSVVPMHTGNFTVKNLVNSPEAENVETRSYGQVMVESGTKVTIPSLKITEDIQFNKKENEESTLTCAITARAGIYYKRATFTTTKQKGSCFGPTDLTMTLADGSTNYNCPGISFLGYICKDTNEGYFANHGIQQFPLEQDFESIETSIEIINDKDNYIKELTYSGLVGDTIKFTYRELLDDLRKPALIQEVFLNLNESSVLEFKNLRLEVINVNNLSVTYKVLQHF
jgi:hypothetical protein